MPDTVSGMPQPAIWISSTPLGGVHASIVWCIVWVCESRVPLKMIGLSKSVSAGCALLTSSVRNVSKPTSDAMVSPYAKAQSGSVEVEKDITGVSTELKYLADGRSPYAPGIFSPRVLASADEMRSGADLRG